MRFRWIALLVALFATVLTVVAQDGKGMPQGENELWLAVSERFGGWGVRAILEAAPRPMPAR